MENKITESTNDQLNLFLRIISFCFGLIGILLYLVYYDKAPVKAKTAIKYTLLGAITFLILVIILLLISGQSDLFQQ